jgi:4-hydroxybenzoate polyprenyltransferase
MNLWLAVVLALITLPLFLLGGFIGFFLWLILLVITHFAVEGKKKAKLEEKRHQELLKAAQNNSDKVKQ